MIINLINFNDVLNFSFFMAFFLFSGGFLLINLLRKFKENHNVNFLKINALQLFYVKNAIFAYIRTLENLEKNLFLFILNKNKKVKNREC